MYHCPGSFCLPFHKVCDGSAHCPGKEDEINCKNYTCPGEEIVDINVYTNSTKAQEVSRSF